VEKMKNIKLTKTKVDPELNEKLKETQWQRRFFATIRDKCQKSLVSTLKK
jgi:hypothetical protein